MNDDALDRAEGVGTLFGHVEVETENCGLVVLGRGVTEGNSGGVAGR